MALTVTVKATNFLCIYVCRSLVCSLVPSPYPTKPNHPHPEMSPTTLQQAATLATLPLTHLAFNPLLSAPLLWLLTTAPPPLLLRNHLTNRIAWLRNPARYATLLRALKWCVALGLTGALNRLLNRVALNAGRVRSGRVRWGSWGSEVAVVTGGSGGIGALVVRRLVDLGVKVAVVDVVELPERMQGCKFDFLTLVCERERNKEIKKERAREKADATISHTRRKHSLLRLRHYQSNPSLRHSRQDQGETRQPQHPHQQRRHPGPTQHSQHARRLPEEALRRQRTQQLVHRQGVSPCHARRQQRPHHHRRQRSKLHRRRQPRRLHR